MKRSRRTEDTTETDTQTKKPRRRQWRSYLMGAVLVGVMTAGIVSATNSPAQAMTSVAVAQEQVGFGTSVTEMTSAAVVPAATNASSDEKSSPYGYAANAKSTNSLQDACRYLTFCRWYGVNTVPMPNIGLDNIQQIPIAFIGGITSFLFMLAGLGAMLMGIVLGVVVGIDLLGRVTYTVDYVFAIVGQNLFGIGNGRIVPSEFIVWVLLASALAFGVKIIIPRLRRPGSLMSGEVGASALRSLVVVLIGVIAATAMSIQAAKNHSTPKLANSGQLSRAALQATGPGTTPLDAPAGATSSWYAIGSPAWIISFARERLDFLDAGISGVANTVSNAFQQSPTQGSYGCIRYTDALHQIFNSTSAASRANTSALIAYDNLIGSMYFNNYKMAAFGESGGANNAWCRSAEVQAGTTAGDQALVSRIAGLYSEAVGSGPVNGIQPIVSSGSNGGTMVTSDGKWNAAQTNSLDGASNASRFFGPVFKSSVAADAATFYFAACEWPIANGGVALNPEWNNVRGADTRSTISSVLDALNPLNGDSTPVDKVSTDLCKNVITNDGSFDDSSANTKAFSYGIDSSATWQKVASIFGYTAGSKLERFDQAQQSDGSNPAAEYFRIATGSGKGGGIVLAATALAVIWLIIRYFGPITIGAAGAQIIAGFALAFLSISVILLVIPNSKTKEFFKRILLTFLTSVVIVQIVSGLFVLMFLMGDIMNGLLVPITTNTFVRAIISAAGYIATFAIVRYIIHHFTPLNLATVRGGLSVATMALSPLASSQFGEVVTPLKRSFWGFGEVEPPGHKKPEVLTDSNSEPIDPSTQDADIITDAGGKKGAPATSGSRMTDRQKSEAIKNASKTDHKGEHKRDGLDKTKSVVGVSGLVAAAAAPFSGGTSLAAWATAAGWTEAGLTGLQGVRGAARWAANTGKQGIRWGYLNGQQILKGDVGRKEGQDANAYLGKRESQLLDSTVPLSPKMDNQSLAESGIVVPNSQNVEALAQLAPGVASAPLQITSGPSGNTKITPMTVLHPQSLLDQVAAIPNGSTSRVGNKTERLAAQASALSSTRPRVIEVGGDGIAKVVSRDFDGGSESVRQFQVNSAGEARENIMSRTLGGKQEMPPVGVDSDEWRSWTSIRDRLVGLAGRGEIDIRNAETWPPEMREHAANAVRHVASRFLDDTAPTSRLVSAAGDVFARGGNVRDIVRDPQVMEHVQNITTNAVNSERVQAVRASLSDSKALEVASRTMKFLVKGGKDIINVAEVIE